MTAVQKMTDFLDWYENKIKSTIPISNQKFIEIMDKFDPQNNCLTPKNRKKWK
jgi:hypothetical protein